PMAKCANRDNHTTKKGIFYCPVVRFPDYLLHKEHIGQSRRQLFANAATRTVHRRTATRTAIRKRAFDVLGTFLTAKRQNERSCNERKIKSKRWRGNWGAQ